MDRDRNRPAEAAEDRPQAAVRAMRGVVGLPARLAILTLLATMTCVAGIAVFADHRIQQAARDRAMSEAEHVAQDVASQLTQSDFEVVDDEFATQLEARLEQLRDGDDAVRQVVLFAAKAERTPKVIMATEGAEDAPFLPLAREVLRTTRAESTIVRRGDEARTRTAWPMMFADGRAGGVVAIEHSSVESMAAVRDARRKLGIGALLGGSLFGAFLLLLLRHELFRPLEEMRRVMVQIRRGARGARIGWTRADELGAVADAFDEMVSELEHAQAELARYVNRDPLTGLLTGDAFTDRFSGELTRARREGYAISLLAIDVDGFAELVRTHDEAAGDQVLAALGDVIGGCTRPTDACGRTGNDSFHVALVGADVSQAAVVIERIRSEVAQRVGIGPERTRVTCGFGIAEYPTHAVDQIALERMAEAACQHAQRGGRDRALAFGPGGGYVDALALVPEEERAGQRPAGQRELASTVHALARALDGIDPSLGGDAHSHRVARYAAAVARELGMSDSQLRELRSAAVLHDIGKVAVPPSILRLSEDELDEQQRSALRYHAWVSRTMISGAGLAPVADIVFHLPERWDGTGYPERAREERIPLASRILRAAELLDELTTGRATAKPLGAFDAAAELKRRAGSELDPDVAVRLARLVREEGLLGSTSDPLADAA